jgi:hypothetical protein
LNHVLTCTGSGRKVPVTEGLKGGWTEDDKLVWENRFKKIDTPTVYYRDGWLHRRLELKELKAVLDVPDSGECGASLRVRLKAMRMPGKVYVTVLDEIRRAFASRRRKIIRPRKEAVRLMTRVADSTSANVELDRKAGAKRRESSGRENESRVTTTTDKAVKSDDAALPVFLWNEAVCRGLPGIEATDEGVSNALDVLRKWLLSYWKKKVMLDLAEYLHNNKGEMSPGEYEKSRLAGLKALDYAGQAGWWKWKGGSYPFFWRWPK